MHTFSQYTCKERKKYSTWDTPARFHSRDGIFSALFSLPWEVFYVDFILSRNVHLPHISLYRGKQRHSNSHSVYPTLRGSAADAFSFRGPLLNKVSSAIREILPRCKFPTPQPLLSLMAISFDWTGVRRCNFYRNYTLKIFTRASWQMNK